MTLCLTNAGIFRVNMLQMFPSPSWDRSFVHFLYLASVFLWNYVAVVVT